MRTAVLSDIHGNAYALEAVLSDVKKRSADFLLNLGDILYGPIAPRSTYDLLMEHDFVTIRGNQDRQIYENASNEIESNPTLSFILKDLGRKPIDWLRSLPFDCRLTDEIYLCHGTPTNDLGYLLERIETGRAGVRPDKEILELLNGKSAKVILCGHTHTPRTVELSTGQLVVNPGSVGLPAYTDEEPVLHSMENFSPHASYAMLEKVALGWTVQHIKVAYDYHRAAKKAARCDRSDWVHFLITGRGL
ncbi:MAG: metallophosphoesterase [Desulfobacteraceae bacterium]|nr:MAG: metallophosphoesterase [Desulfobacteraceae bacterium]